MSDRIHVLLVEDNPGDANLLVEILPKDGPVAFEVECVPRLATALERVTEEHFDALLVDLNLPDSTGLATVRALRQAAADSSMVVITGHSDEEAGISAIREGAQDYVVKGTASVESLPRILCYAVERDRSARRLRESEERYRSLFESMLEGFAYCRMLYDDRGRPVDWIHLAVNDAFTNLTGLMDVVGKRVTELIPGVKEDFPELFETCRRVASTGQPEVFEIDFTPLSRWLRGAVYSPGEGCFVTVFQDITKRKQAEQALREREQYFRALIENAADIITVVDASGTILFNSPSCERLLGYRPEELTGQSLFHFAHADEHGLGRERLRALVQGQNDPSWTTELRFRHKDRSWRVLEVKATRLVNHLGEVSCVLNSRDITHRKKTEEALRLTQLSVDGAADLIHWIASDGRVLYVSDSTCRRHGYSREELLAMTVFDLDPSMSPKAWRMVWRELKEKGSVTIESVHRAKDGEVFPIEATLNFVECEGTEYNFVFARDITERERTAEELRQAAVRLTQLAEGTIHALSSLAEERDPYTAGHQRRVAELSCAIGAQMGLAPESIAGLRTAALLHDIGKVAVPIEILSKPGALSFNEMELVRTHPEVGYQILKDIDFNWPVAQIVRQHHERMDGSGYPRGMTGAGILLEARILAVADVVESMSSHRPYRPALGLQAALAEVSRRNGMFDHKVVKACATVFRTRAFDFESARPSERRRRAGSMRSRSPVLAPEAFAKGM